MRNSAQTPRSKSALRKNQRTPCDQGVPKRSGQSKGRNGNPQSRTGESLVFRWIWPSPWRRLTRGKLGSASQFIEVPDLKKDRLALSGVFLTTASDAAAQNAGPAAQPGATEGQADDGSNQLRAAAVRRFRQGAKIDFLYNIYNAHTDASNVRPQLQTQVRIFRDGEVVFTGPLLNYDVGKQTDLKRLQSGGRLSLGTSLTILVLSFDQ